MNLTKHSLILFCGLSASGMGLAAKAEADSFTITPSPPAAITTTTVSLGAGDVVTVEQGGVIDVITGNGIEATADGVTVNNAGSVTSGDASGIFVLGESTVTNSGTATGNGLDRLTDSGIWANGNNNTIINSGTATGLSFGIFTNGNHNTITNSGLANNTMTNLGVDEGYTCAGIFAQGSNNTITNLGTVTTCAWGIWASGNNNTIINSGIATGYEIYGIWATGDGNTITNSGKATGGETGIRADGTGNTITNLGTADGGVYGVGIYANGNNNTITNLGTAEGGGYGIWANGNNNITNSGQIIGGGAAVHFYGSDNTLTLLAGSNVQGSLDLAGDGGNSLVIGRRLNTALRFTAVPEVATETNGMPYVAFGGILAVVDPTVFRAEDFIVPDVTAAVADNVDARLGRAAGQSANGIVVSTSNAPDARSPWQTWASGIVRYHSQHDDGFFDGFDSKLGGYVLGADIVLSSGTRFGSFVGASRAHVNTNAGNEQIDTATAYAGLYARYTLPNTFVNLALTAGYANADTSRDVLNNMVVGGIEQAKGSSNGVFFAPQATIGTEIKNARGIVTPSLRVAYTRLTMGSYDETGSAADMSVGSRTVNVVDLRGQVAFAIKPIVTSTGQFDATMRLGADATLTNSDDITATLLDQPITFSTSSQDTTLRGFAGVDLVHAMDNGADLKLSVEAGYDTGHAVTLIGTAGVAWAF